MANSFLLQYTNTYKILKHLTFGLINLSWKEKQNWLKICQIFYFKNTITNQNIKAPYCKLFHRKACKLASLTRFQHCTPSLQCLICAANVLCLYSKLFCSTQSVPSCSNHVHGALWQNTAGTWDVFGCWLLSTIFGFCSRFLTQNCLGNYC